MMVNLTNHPNSMWGEEQLKAAGEYGEILDMPFPVVPSDADESDVRRMADEYLAKIIPLRPKAVLCQGEMTLTYELVRRMIEHGINVVAACSERVTKVELQKDGSIKKESRFDFKRFRKYDTNHSEEGGQ